MLLAFLALGMLAGEEGPGGIYFDDVQTAHLIGSLALAIILFNGGLCTDISSFRVGLWPAFWLATVGVVLTAVITGLAAAWFFQVNWVEGLLIGAIVGSTDAAAVFSILHAHGLQLKQRVDATLQIESGINDPMAIFLTITLVEIIAAGHTHIDWVIIRQLFLQMGIGAAVGILGGWLLAWLINRVSLSSGLYPLLAFSGGLLTYGATAVAGGSGYLAVYLAGLILGNRRLQAAQNIHRYGYELVGYKLTKESPALYRPPTRLSLPKPVKLATIIRQGEILDINEVSTLEENDYIFLFARTEDLPALDRLFTVVHVPARLEEQRFFGELVLNADAGMAEIADFYGLTVESADRTRTLEEFLVSIFGQPVVGDRVRVGRLEFVVREMEGRSILKVGLKLIPE